MFTFSKCLKTGRRDMDAVIADWKLQEQKFPIQQRQDARDFRIEFFNGRDHSSLDQNGEPRDFTWSVLAAITSINLSNLQRRLLAFATPSNAFGTTALMCFLFQGRDDSVETLDIGSTNAMDHRAFQCG